MDVTMQEVLDDLCKILQRTPVHMETIMNDVRAHYKRTMTALLLPSPPLAVPLHFKKEVRFMNWWDVPFETQEAVRILSDEVAGGRIKPLFIEDYVRAVIKTNYGRPCVPTVYQLSQGPLT